MTNEVALWMMGHGYATGHGDTLADLLGELVHQVHANALLEAHNAAQAVPGRGDLTKIAAECHRAKWQFDFSDENRLPVGQARDMVKRAFGELHRIGDMALKLRDGSASSPAQASWMPMDTVPRDGRPVMLTGITAGGSRWYMDGQVYAKGWIGGSAVGCVPNYWQPIPGNFAMQSEARPASTEGKPKKVCLYSDGCPMDGPVCHLCAHVQPGVASSVPSAECK